MSSDRAVQRVNITNKLSFRPLFAVHLQLSFVPTYRSARYLFVVYPQAGIIDKTILAIVQSQKLLGTTETEKQSKRLLWALLSVQTCQYIDNFVRELS